jgi:hypothetical protein
MMPRGMIQCLWHVLHRQGKNLERTTKKKANRGPRQKINQCNSQWHVWSGHLVWFTIIIMIIGLSRMNDSYRTEQLNDQVDKHHL